mmetsp:Transcript_21963/g.32909  ORF Transcript_21963/g.32909 Transcript_21963/m.32909 type:complete len:96 (-) Transcript_21963:280-567(-)
MLFSQFFQMSMEHITKSRAGPMKMNDQPLTFLGRIKKTPSQNHHPAAPRRWKYKSHAQLLAISASAPVSFSSVLDASLVIFLILNLRRRVRHRIC